MVASDGKVLRNGIVTVAGSGGEVKVVGDDDGRTEGIIYQRVQQSLGDNLIIGRR